MSFLKTIQLGAAILLFGPAPSNSLFLPREASGDAATKAFCVTRNLTVNVNTSNDQILYPQQFDQANVTQLVQYFGSVDPALTGQYVGSKKVPLKKGYQIEATFCTPGQSDNGKVLVLTSGVGFDKSYWDAKSDNSYYSFVKFATDHGYSTLAYDRLGVGGSQKPDPLQEVQSHVDVEIQHGIIGLLRTGKQIATKPAKTIIGIGHSYGSLITLSNNAKYPEDTDASVITGLGSSLQNLPLGILSAVPSIAAYNDPARFSYLPPGYLVHRDNASIAQAFLRYPYYTQEILDEYTRNKALYTVGQLLTIGEILGSASNYTKPVDIVDGQYDFPACGGDCSYNGTDDAAAALASYYPKAAQGSRHYLVPRSGHCINLQSGAHDAYQQIIDFLNSNVH